MPADTQPVVTPAPVIPPATPGTDLGKSTPDDFEKTNTALDDLLKAAAVSEEGDEPVPDEPSAPPAPPAPPAPVPAAPPAPPAPPVPVPDPAAPPAPPAPPAPAPDEFDGIEIPPHSKPKSVEAFATVKTIARERIAAVTKEKAELAAKLAAAEEAAKLAPAEVTKELEELRKFRLEFDVEADPSFKTWDKTVKENEDLIYVRLKAAGFTEENLKTIRDLGGPGMVDWEVIKDKINPQLKRYIEGKVFENEDLAEKKKQAVEKAKSNAAEFVKTRQEEIYNNTEGRQKATKVEFDAMLPKFKWLEEQPIPATAKPEERAKIEAANAFTKKVLADVQEAIADDSPSMRAILIGGFAQLMKVRADLESVKTSHSAEIAKLTAAIAEKDAFIARIKKSSTSRLTGKGSSTGDPAPAPKSSVNEEPVDALDRHLKEALAKLE